MSNRERINANNASIQACIDKAHALPDAGSGVDDEFKPVSIDLSNFDTEGQIVETDANGNTKTTIVEFDDNGNPIKITNSDGDVIELTW